MDSGISTTSDVVSGGIVGSDGPTSAVRRSICSWMVLPRAAGISVGAWLDAAAGLPCVLAWRRCMVYCALANWTCSCVMQPAGPRFVAGDLNLLLHKVPQLARLQCHGFVEIQDLRAARQGVSPEVTCKNSSRKDFLFVSPELQEMFLACKVDPTYWADHSVVSASFRPSRVHLSRFVWRMPRPRAQQPQGSLLDDDLDVGLFLSY